MKIPPDKIYIPIIEEDGKRLLCTNWWETDTSSRNAYVNETIPYIRKDALLEWATTNRDKLDVLSDNDAVRWGQRNAFQQMIDKLNSL